VQHQGPGLFAKLHLQEQNHVPLNGMHSANKPHLVFPVAGGGAGVGAGVGAGAGEGGNAPQAFPIEPFMHHGRFHFFVIWR